MPCAASAPAPRTTSSSSAAKGTSTSLRSSPTKVSPRVVDAALACNAVTNDRGLSISNIVTLRSGVALRVEQGRQGFSR
ncbi:Uncharacterised protein [Mycobacteroides abscessus subsp. abscessus]|nr:Uncharacterised protein [Mycobacteroides abscessus subsp. abscessus]